MADTTTASRPSQHGPPAGPSAPMVVVLLSAWFMSQFDFFVVNVAAPSFGRELGAGPAALQLIVGGQIFAYAAGMITGGRLGDLYGTRRMFVGGMIAFTVMSLLCGLAANPAQLVVARLVQGLTAAMMVPQVLAVITTVFPAETRTRALGWYGAAGGLGSIAGQVLGGLLLTADVFGLGWRVIFFVNVPLGVVAAIIAARLLPRAVPDQTAEPGHRARPGRVAKPAVLLRDAQARTSRGCRRSTAKPGPTPSSAPAMHAPDRRSLRTPTLRPALDPLGAAGIATALALVLVPLVLGHEAGWPAWTWICMVIALPVGALTMAWQRRLGARGGQPILDVSLLRVPSFVAGVAATGAFMAYFAGFMFTLTLLLQAGFGLTALQAGLTFAPMGILFSATAVLSYRLVGRYGLRIVVAGGALIVGSLLVLALLLRGADDTAGLPWLIVLIGAVGIGNGIVMPQLIGVALVGVRPHQAGVGSGIVTTAQQFAGAAGIAAVGTVFFAVAGVLPAAADYAQAMAWSTLIYVGLVSLVISLVGYNHRVFRAGSAAGPGLVSRPAAD